MICGFSPQFQTCPTCPVQRETTNPQCWHAISMPGVAWDWGDLTSQLNRLMSIGLLGSEKWVYVGLCYPISWGVITISIKKYGISLWRPVPSGETNDWLVVWSIFYFPFHIWDVILPIDELHHFSRCWKFTTNQMFFSLRRRQNFQNIDAWCLDGPWS